MSLPPVQGEDCTQLINKQTLYLYIVYVYSVNEYSYINAQLSTMRMSGEGPPLFSIFSLHFYLCFSVKKYTLTNGHHRPRLPGCPLCSTDHNFSIIPHHPHFQLFYAIKSIPLPPTVRAFADLHISVIQPTTICH